MFTQAGRLAKEGKSGSYAPGGSEDTTGKLSPVANAMGIKVSVSVVDARGDPIALARMDGARFFTADVPRAVKQWFPPCSVSLLPRSQNGLGYPSCRG